MKINLLKNYPKSKRNLNSRYKKKTNKIKSIARKFDREYFDGDRDYGYGGYNYHPKFWFQVVKDFKKKYKLNNKSKILDIGCGKGFMLHEFKKLLPSIKTFGIDISEYAIKNSMKSVKKNLIIGNCKKLPYKNNFFDLVIAINTLHNLPIIQVQKAIREIQRVTKKNSFIMVDAYKNNNEKKRMFMWNLTAKTILHESNWIKLFKNCSYNGDYYWFKP